MAETKYVRIENNFIQVLYIGSATITRTSATAPSRKTLTAFDKILMREQVLIDYLQYKVPVKALAEDLKGSKKRNGYDVTTVYIHQLQSEIQFLVKREHLIRLCDEALNGHLDFNDLGIIAFALFSSEHIHRDTSDEILEVVLFAWDNPEIGFPLTTENMKKWKVLLETGADTFDPRELNQKSKTGG